MENLLHNLQRTIKALEVLSEKNLPETEQAYELLDQLFQQKIDLLNLSGGHSGPAYQQASQAFGQAAVRAERGKKDAAHLREAVPIIEDAMAKLAKYLNSADR